MSSEIPLTLDEFPPVTLVDWRRRVVERFDGEHPSTLGRHTLDGVDLRALYTSEDLDEETWAAGPVLFEAGWSVCALTEGADPVECAASLAQSLDAGAEGFWLRFDRAARLGVLPDQEQALESLGVGGVAIHHGSDLALALGELDPGGLEIWLDAGGNALPATALLLGELERREIAPEEVALHCGADPLGALARDSRLPRDLMKLESEMAALARFSAGHLPAGRAIALSTVPYQEAGATVVQELSYGVATLMACLRALEDSGLGVERSAGEIALRIAVGTDVFVEIAKLRAVRLLWSMVLGACGLEQAPPAKIHAIGSARCLSRRDPMNNVLRATGQMFAAGCGGADSVTLRGFDDAIGPSDRGARRLALTTQLILAQEAHLDRVSDPAAGSYFVETLTRDLVRAAWTEAQEIERAGGMRESLLSGRIAMDVRTAARRRRSGFEASEQCLTGVTEFVLAEEVPLDRPAPESSALQRAALERLRTHRDTVQGAGGVEPVTYSRDFVIEELVSLACGGATMAELGERLGGVEGAETCESLPLRRDAAPFESDFGKEGG